MNNQEELTRNLKRFRRWLCENAIARVINGFLPTFLDDKTKKMQVIVNDGMQPCTDGETIYVSLLPPFLEDGWTFEDWMIVLKAATAHEAQHVNSSNFDDVEDIRKWYGQYLTDNYQLDASIGGNIASEALNIVEDGRIERIAIQRRPGMYVPFRILNDVIREGTAIMGKAETPTGEYRDFWRTILSYAKTGLYSPGVEIYAGTRMENIFLGVQSLIDDGIASNSSTKCRCCVQELLEDVAPYIVDLIKSDPNLENSLKKQKVQREYTSNNGTPEKPGQSSGSQNNPLRVPSPASGQTPQEGQPNGNPSQSGQPSGDPSQNGQPNGNSSQNGQSAESGKFKNGEGKNMNAGKGDASKGKSQKGKSQGAGGSVGDGSSNGGAPMGQDGPSQNRTGFADAVQRRDPLTQSQMDEVRQMLERELASANQAEQAAKTQPDPDAPNSREIENIRAEYSGRTLPIHYSALTIPCTKELPPELKLQAQSLHKEIIRIREARNRFNKGLRRGTLDTGALWKTGLREDAIFSRKRNPDSGSVAFYILIDNSGSNNSPASLANPDLRKYQAARSAAAVVEEAIRDIAPCKIALFDQSSMSVNHCVIKGFDEKKSGNRSWNSLSAIGTGGCNMDSVNIRIAAMELMRRSEKKKVLFLLSDGLPSAYGSKSEAYAEVRQAVLAARRKGVIVIPIMFGTEDFLRSSQPTYELMYEKNIISCVPKEITPRLCTLFRQVICR